VAYLVHLIRRYERGRRFWRNVDVRGRQDCWPWRGNYEAPAGGADIRAWELARGPLPSGASLAHSCGHAGCVNPEHMRVVAPGAQ
jgi:hypothetical protein